MPHNRPSIRSAMHFRSTIRSIQKSWVRVNLPAIQYEEAAFFHISVPSLFVLCCWCWRFGSRFDPLLLFPDTSDRTSSLTVKAPWQTSLGLIVQWAAADFYKVPFRKNNVLLWNDHNTYLTVTVWCHFHFPLETAKACSRYFFFEHWDTEALWLIMQSASQVCELDFLHQRGRTEWRYTFFFFLNATDILLTCHKLSLSFCGKELTKPSGHKIHPQNRTSASSSHLWSLVIVFSKSCLHRYSHLTFSWSVRTSACAERPFAAQSEKTRLNAVSGRVCREWGLHCTAQAKERPPSSSGPSAFLWTPPLSSPPLSCAVPAGDARDWHVPSLQRN